MSLIGTHVSVAGGLWKAIERGEALGCEAIQIFTKNQLQWRAFPIPEPAATRFMAAWAKSSIRKVVAHGSYLLNLASVKETREKSIAALVEEIARCEALGIDDLVLHPGSHLGDGLDNGRKRGGRRIEAGHREDTKNESQGPSGDHVGPGPLRWLDNRGPGMDT